MPSFPRQSLPECRQLAGSLFRTMAYCSVMLSLWQAPLPWLHCHSAGGADQVTQQTHVAAYHPGREQQRAWHLHFALLSDIVRGGGCPVPPDDNGRDRESQQTIALASELSAGSPRLLQSASWLSSILPAAPADVAATSALADVRFFDRHPLNRFALSGDLLPLLCVSRC